MHPVHVIVCIQSSTLATSKTVWWVSRTRTLLHGSLLASYQARSWLMGWGFEYGVAWLVGCLSRRHETLCSISAPHELDRQWKSRSWTHSLVGRQTGQGAVVRHKGGELPQSPNLRQKPGSLKQRPCRLLSPTSRPPEDGQGNKFKAGPRTWYITQLFWASQPSCPCSNWPTRNRGGKFCQLKTNNNNKSTPHQELELFLASACQRVFFSVSASCVFPHVFNC